MKHQRERAAAAAWMILRLSAAAVVLGSLSYAAFAR
jgi:hypothetical protein